VHSLIFSKITWRNLAGMEALSVCFKNKNITENVAIKDNGSKIAQAVQVLNKAMNFIYLLDQKNSVANV